MKESETIVVEQGDITLTNKETKEIIRFAGFIGLVLYQKYRLEGVFNNANFDDQAILDKYFGSSVPLKRVTVARLKLTKMGLFSRTKKDNTIYYTIGRKKK